MLASRPRYWGNGGGLEVRDWVSNGERVRGEVLWEVVCRGIGGGGDGHTVL